MLLTLLFLPMAAAGEKPYGIGIILPGDQCASGVDGLKEGMREVGYIEGRDLHYFLMNVAGDKVQVEGATRRFVADKVDLIYTPTHTP